MKPRTPEVLREQQRDPEQGGIEGYIAERLNLQEQTARKLSALQSSIERTRTLG
ncbi:MAG: hypothetical protein PHS73_02660 [Candidatus Peribacteraceae bacterium]|nr:hypothetical protein [Candidatus Peribacteraceae bacterium]